MIFENTEKLERAKVIVALVNGMKAPTQAGEVERKDNFTKIFASENVDSKSEEAIQFVYEKLGGSLITEEQKAEKEAKKVEIRKRKKMVE